MVSNRLIVWYYLLSIKIIWNSVSISHTYGCVTWIKHLRAHQNVKKMVEVIPLSFWGVQVTPLADASTPRIMICFIDPFSFSYISLDWFLMQGISRVKRITTRYCPQCQKITKHKHIERIEYQDGNQRVFHFLLCMNCKRDTKYS